MLMLWQEEDRSCSRWDWNDVCGRSTVAYLSRVSVYTRYRIKKIHSAISNEPSSCSTRMHRHCLEIPDGVQQQRSRKKTIEWPRCILAGHWNVLQIWFRYHYRIFNQNKPIHRLRPWKPKFTLNRRRNQKSITFTKWIHPGQRTRLLLANRPDPYIEEWTSRFRR